METIVRKTLLYRSGVEYGDFCINHVEGCAHGCLYPCYAMMMKRRAGVVHGYEEWRKPKLVSNALDLLGKEVPRYLGKIKFVHLCFSTDPFMYEYSDVAALSLEIMRRLNEKGIPCTVLTKGVYPGDAGDEISLPNGSNRYGISLVSLSEQFREEYEPFAAPVGERIGGLSRLHQKGLRTWVSLEPYPPPNILQQDLLAILKELAFVDEVVFGKLNYNPKANSFKHAKEFYESQAKVVVEFCRKRGIKYHIKNGTASKAGRASFVATPEAD